MEISLARLIAVMVVMAALGALVGYAGFQAFGWWGLLLTVPVCFLAGVGARTVAGWSR